MSDLTLLLGVEARERFVGVFEKLNSLVEKSSKMLNRMGETGDAAGSMLDKALLSPIDTTNVLNAALARVALAEQEMADASAKLSASFVASADGEVAAMQRQIAASDELLAAQRKLAFANRQAVAAENENTAALERQAKAEAAAGGAASTSAGFIDTYGKKSAIVTAVLGGIIVSSIQAAVKFNLLTVAIANNSNISTEAAGKITDAFVQMSTQSIYSANDLAGAYSKVGGQLSTIYGKALTTSQAVSFMNVAQEMAAASGSNLGSITTNLAKIMRLYDQNVGQASATAGDLYNASRLTGIGLSQMINSMTRVKSQLGVLAPSIGDTSTLILDMAEHGQQGRMAVSMLSQMLNKLVQSGKASTPTMQEIVGAISKLPPELQALATGYANGQIKAAAFQAQLKKISSTNPTYGTYLKSLQSLVEKSKESEGTLNALNLTPAQNEMSKLGVHIYNASGNFVGFGSVIQQLGPKLQKIKGQQEQLRIVSLLFGNTVAKKVLPLILAGKQGWEKATKAIHDQKAMMEASKRAQDTMEASMAKLHHTVTAVRIEFGAAMVPIVEKVAGVFARVIAPVASFISKNKNLVAIVVGVVAAISTFITTLWALHKIYTVVRNSAKLLGSVWNGLGKLVAPLAEKMGLLEAANVATAVSEDAVAVSADAAAIGIWAILAPILAIVAAAALIIAAIYLLWKHWHTVWSFIKRIAKDVAHFFVSAWKAAWSIIKPIWQAILSLAKLIFTGIKIAVFIALLPIMPLIVAFYELYKHWKAVWAGIMTVVNWIYSNIIEPIIGYFKMLWDDGIKPVMNFIVSGFETEWRGLKAIVGWIGSNIIHPIATLFSWLWNNGIKPVMDFIWKGLQSAWHTISSIAGWINSNIIQPIIGYWNDLVKFFESLGSTIANIATSIWDGFYNAFVGVANLIISAYNDTVGLIPGMSISTLHTVGGGSTPKKSKSTVSNSIPNVTPGSKVVGGTGGKGNVNVTVNVSGQVYGSLNDFSTKLGNHLTTKVLPHAGVTLAH